MAACGGGREKARDGNGLGVRGLLKQAFAGGDETSFEGGGLCGDPLLVGERIGTVDGNGVCGVEDAVSLRAIGSVTLSQPATLNCKTAQTLRSWLETGAKPAIGKRGGGLSELKVAAHYACRTRNHQRGAKISEHGKGNAIDISAVRLKDGTEISVLHHWGRGKDGKALKEMHKSACGPFGTVLGPGSDGFHKDHLHFDTASYRSGSYCR
ncbi:extensin family protein [Tropicibacter sp. S64]|uniref:extensin-like domain-containing protein n=1 Tax=Tropicibacter sp. S64 TaxID=3415122 RepID=UPI003C7AE71F